MTRAVDEQLARLETMTSVELRATWRKQTDAPSPRMSPKLLRLAVAWEIQARAFGGHTRDTTRQLQQIADGKTNTAPAVPGMQLVREWQGRVHVITVDEGGTVVWEDRSYRSLSEVARAITGTRWSGPAFFGLKRKVAA